MSSAPPVILVIDDDDEMLRLVTLAFRRTAATVVTQNGGFGALTAIASRRPVVVLLDVTMPGLDGPAVVELVRGDPELARTRVIFWSALGREALDEARERSGADAAIPKTAGATALVDQVCDWLLAWDGVDLRA